MPERTWDDIVSHGTVASYETAVVRTLYQENTILRAAIEEAIEGLRLEGDYRGHAEDLQRALTQCDKLA